MFETHVDTSKLLHAMEKFAKESRKELGEVVEKQGAIMVGHLIAFTPPGAAKGQALGDRGGIAISAKKHGENAIKADIAKLFPTTAIRDDGKIHGMIDNGFEWGTGRGKKTIREFADTVTDLERVHSFARSRSTGRVRTGSTGQNMALTRKAIRNQFIKKKIRQVGILNAGWLRAARKLRTAKRNTPAWITRHGNKAGDVNFRHSKSGLTITVSNKVPYFPRDIESRVKRAVSRRTYGLEQALEAMIERKAKRATERMR